jgi:predicted alpha/beta-fold hydrolase
MQPIRSHNKSGWAGVVWDKRSRRWHASLRVAGQLFHLGWFEDREEAAMARARAIARLSAEAGE